MPISFEDSRRLTGPNRHFAGTGAALEALATHAIDSATIARWREDVLRACAALEWHAVELDARPHRGGASLAFTAPIDCLYTATEVNEWAWQRSAGCNDGFHAPGFASIDDAVSALHTLKLLAIAEHKPNLLALVSAARAHDVPIYPDDDFVSLGEGRGSRVWALAELPAADAVDWPALHSIPKAVVTGSNGKTTSVRLLAAMLRAAGHCTGHTCTDGVFVDGQPVESGDFSGPSGARAILRDAQVDAAVLETARGGMLRRGLGVARADVALITNVSPDHYGEYGIHDLDDLIGVKLTVARLIDQRGSLVLNADDAGLLRHAADLSCPLAWFALNDDHPLLHAHRAAGGATCAVDQGMLMLCRNGERIALGAIDAMPLSVGGIATYNISNLAGAALSAALLGVPPAVIAEVLGRFGADRSDNIGRLQRWQIGDIDVLLDYAHNPDGLEGFLGIAGHARRGRLGLLLGQAGNRGDDDVRQLAAVAARHRPDRVVLKDIDGFIRGRETGEIAAILHAQLLSSGVPADGITTVLDEARAARELIQWARAGDVVALPVHAPRARAQLTALLNQLEASGWRAGAPIPDLIAPAAAS